MDFIRGALGVISLSILMVVFLLLCWTSWQNHRKPQKTQDNFHGSVIIELTWVVAPFVIVWALVWPAFRDLWVP
ncbi:MAG: cytochrome c oxidase subunit II transmembrane domain-containing protein [Burkholderiaceae bacterium]|jgi:heme/copper-type cytochrome/quinol oxidase subunit 2